MENVNKTLKAFQESIRKAVLNGKIEMKFKPMYNLSYRFELEISVNGGKCAFSVADNFICYHNPLLEGTFNEKKDIPKLKKMAEKHFNFPSEETKKRIMELKDEIKKLEGSSVYF